MADALLRVLLDQGFPALPGFDPSDLDATVDFVPLSKFDRRLAEDSTPDWLLVLVAAHARFDVLVTDDAAMLTEDVTLTALCLTPLSLVTWDGGMADPATRWAQLLAYVPEVKRRLRAGPPTIFRLPRPRLDVRQTERASAIIDASASRAGTTGREIRARWRAEIQAELRRRGRTELLPLLSSGGDL